MHSHYLNGQWITGAGPQLVVVNPASGRQIWAGTAATGADIDAACRAARASFGAWAKTALADRIAICTRFRDLLKEHSEELALLISQ